MVLLAATSLLALLELAIACGVLQREAAAALARTSGVASRAVGAQLLVSAWTAGEGWASTAETALTAAAGANGSAALLDAAAANSTAAVTAAAAAGGASGVLPMLMVLLSEGILNNASSASLLQLLAGRMSLALLPSAAEGLIAATSV